MGVDMEAAQVQGTSDSFLSINEPEYSGISTNDPDEFALYFVRVCISGVTSLKSYVTPDVLKCLVDFPYMKTGEGRRTFYVLDSARVGAAKTAEKVTDQAVKDAQTALSAAKGTSTRRKSGKGFVLGTVFSPRYTSQTDLTPVTATIPALPFIDSSLAPAPVDVALPFDFGDDLVLLDNLGFMSETSQPLNVSLNNVPLANIVPGDNWFFANMSQGGGDFAAPSSQLDWNARGPDSLDPSSSTGAGGIDLEGWDTDIVSTESEFPILPSPPRRPHTRPPLLSK
ncbi:hypothetical protein B0H14DRAFT_3871684 [Mycena olivaceomarginata]|nr:hypothetical protein B0H14DRAFT_3871684 [Mycena olivaceomarginata]